MRNDDRNAALMIWILAAVALIASVAGAFTAAQPRTGIACEYPGHVFESGNGYWQACGAETAPGQFAVGIAPGRDRALELAGR